ncbi:hypothetical protein P2318_09460 [Myxococcaceae bacterium GXIMD 01537]
MLKCSRWLIAASALAVVSVLAMPSGVEAYKRWRVHTARAVMARFVAEPGVGEASPELVRELKEASEDLGPLEPGEVRGGDALRRQVAARVRWGEPSGEALERRAEVAHAEAQRWRETLPSTLGPDMRPQASAMTGQSWVSLGPADAASQVVGEWEVDSGRVTGIAASRAYPNEVYVATSGGLWKTFEFHLRPDLRWLPVGDTLGQLALGAVDVAWGEPRVVHVGTGDYETWGGQMVRSTDGAATWGAPVTLAGTYAGSFAVRARHVRVVKVDPANPNIVLAGTDVGLFRSTDGGLSYTLVDLPNSTSARPEAIWSIVYTGSVGGVSRWALSGVYACAAGVLPPRPGMGRGTGTSGCSNGTPGDIWTSTDGGATWQSRRVSGGLPSPLPSVGRITLGAGTPSSASPPVTVVYAQLGNMDEYNGSAGLGYWRSNTSGTSWTSIPGTLANPTQSGGGMSSDCANVNVNGAQAWYNAAVAVDPDNNGNVLVGGMLCALRTLNGLSASPTWENVAHWSPSDALGNVSGGRLAYVHADWQAAVVTGVPGDAIAIAGTEGGLSFTHNLFTAPPRDVRWEGQNRGLVTHQAVSVGSGDPASGNPYVALTGLQGLGVRLRDPRKGERSATFNQLVGGDGSGAAVSKDPASSAAVYWAGSSGEHATCVPSAANGECASPGDWQVKDPAPLSCSTGLSDDQPFTLSYEHLPAHPRPNTFLALTDRGVHRVSGTGSWAAVSGCLTGLTRSVWASLTLDGLYGVSMSSGRFQVTGNCTGDTTACTWTQSSVLGFDVSGNGLIETREQLSFTTAVAFPTTTPAGKLDGDVYVAASVATLAMDNLTPVPDALGHLFITQDRGATWTPLHGNGTGFDLPNVGIDVVRFDPTDATNNTLFVGTELGLYRTTDGGQTWRRYGRGLPMARVTDLFISRNGSMMRVATWGRGLWEIHPSATSEKGVAGSGDWNRDQVLDFRDLAAAASRLGTDPSTQTAPYYDWNLDLNGSVNGLDSADLEELLGRMGGRP